MATRKQTSEDLPAGAGNLARKHPSIWSRYAALGEATSNAGPLNEKSRRLVKIALAIGAGLEGAVHSHVRRAILEGLSVDDIRHVALLAIPTLGLPSAVRAMTWIDDIPARRKPRQKAR